jgi:hypothetical protein
VTVLQANCVPAGLQTTGQQVGESMHQPTEVGPPSFDGLVRPEQICQMFAGERLIAHSQVAQEREGLA